MLNKKKTFYFTVFILLALLIVGCTIKEQQPQTDEKKEEASKYPIQAADGLGNKELIDHKPERIISLAPSHTEILYGLGLGDNIVGVTTYCDYPVEAKDKPKIGDSFTINLEKIIELQPDIVINYWPIDDSLRSQLKEAGIIVLTYSPESIEQIIDTIEQIGMVTDREEKAKNLVDSILNKKDVLVKKVKGISKPKVFYEIEYSSALWTAGEGSFIDELITLSGGENIAKDAQGAYAQYSVEALIEKNPEIYITNTFNIQPQDKSIIQNRPGYDSIKAIKDNRIEILDGNILSRPSQRVVEALDLMVKAIHPELFE